MFLKNEGILSKLIKNENKVYNKFDSISDKSVNNKIINSNSTNSIKFSTLNRYTTGRVIIDPSYEKETLFFWSNLDNKMPKSKWLYNPENESLLLSKLSYDNLNEYDLNCERDLTYLRIYRDLCHLGKEANQYNNNEKSSNYLSFKKKNKNSKNIISCIKIPKPNKKDY